MRERRRMGGREEDEIEGKGGRENLVNANLIDDLNGGVFVVGVEGFDAAERGGASREGHELAVHELVNVQALGAEDGEEELNGGRGLVEGEVAAAEGLEEECAAKGGEEGEEVLEGGAADKVEVLLVGPANGLEGEGDLVDRALVRLVLVEVGVVAHGLGEGKGRRGWGGRTASLTASKRSGLMSVRIICWAIFSRRTFCLSL